MAPLTRYAGNGDVNLAYQVHGDGPLDLLFVSAYINHVEHIWEDPGLARFLNRLAGFARLIVMDRRGSGLSDDGDLSVEAELGDIHAVLDAAGSERAALFSYTAGGPLAAIFAARNPARVASLVLYGCMLRAVRDDDLPWLPDAAERDARFEGLLAAGGRARTSPSSRLARPATSGCRRGTRAWSAWPRARAACAA
jgi:pimeloyl-ACP methyl ester carboxylesterase